MISINFPIIVKTELFGVFLYYLFFTLVQYTRTIYYGELPQDQMNRKFTFFSKEQGALEVYLISNLYKAF